VAMLRMIGVFVLLSVNLGGGFGDAAAVATDRGDGTISVEIEVEAPGAAIVAAHFIDPGDGQETRALGARTGDVFGGIMELEQANLVVVFEAIDGRGDSLLSRPVTLLELGIDPAALGTNAPTVLLVEESADQPRFSPEIERGIWIAVGFAAASLALLAYWVAGPKPTPARGDGSSEEE